MADLRSTQTRVRPHRLFWPAFYLIAKPLTLLRFWSEQRAIDPAPAPRLDFPMVWGGGVEYDATAGLSEEERQHRLYAFLEPIQTKQVYWRALVGAEKLLGPDLEPKWDKRFKINAEWRSEPWIPKNTRGLRAVKLRD